MIKIIFDLLLLVNAAYALQAPAILGNQRIADFREAKKLALQIHKGHQTSIYCPCTYSGKSIDIRSCGYIVHSDPKRAARLEWEHIVPAEAFGQAFKEWHEGAPQCVKKS